MRACAGRLRDGGAVNGDRDVGALEPGVDPEVVNAFADLVDEVRVVVDGAARDLAELAASLRRRAAEARKK